LIHSGTSQDSEHHKTLIYYISAANTLRTSWKCAIRHIKWQQVQSPGTVTLCGTLRSQNGTG